VSEESKYESLVLQGSKNEVLKRNASALCVPCWCSKVENARFLYRGLVRTISGGKRTMRVTVGASHPWPSRVLGRKKKVHQPFWYDQTWWQEGVGGRKLGTLTMGCRFYEVSRYRLRTYTRRRHVHLGLPVRFSMHLHTPLQQIHLGKFVRSNAAQVNFSRVRNKINARLRAAAGKRFEGNQRNPHRNKDKEGSICSHTFCCLLIWIYIDAKFSWFSTILFTNYS